MRKTDDEGFTLMEIVIVLAIMGILAVLAYSGYGETLRKQRRLDAMNGLLQIQAAQQRYLAHHGRYARTLVELGWPAEPAASAAGHYLLRLREVAAQGYEAVAEPHPAGSQARDVCRRFVLDQDGPAPDRSTDPGCWTR